MEEAVLSALFNLYLSEDLRAPVAFFTCDQAVDRSASEWSARVAEEWTA